MATTVHEPIDGAVEWAPLQAALERLRSARRVVGAARLVTRQVVAAAVTDIRDHPIAAATCAVSAGLAVGTILGLATARRTIVIVRTNISASA